MKKLVIFDFFGTLGYFPKINGFLLFLGLIFLGYNPLAKKDLKEQLKTFLSSSKSWDDLAEKIAECLEKKTSERLVKLLQGTVKFKLYDESKKILSYLIEENHPVAILTNGGSFLFEDFTLPGAKIFTPQVTGWEKPHQNAFLYVLKTYGSVPEKTLMVGDSLTDVIPAADLGMIPFLLGEDGEAEEYKRYIPIKKLGRSKSISRDQKKQPSGCFFFYILNILHPFRRFDA